MDDEKKLHSFGFFLVWLVVFFFLNAFNKISLLLLRCISTLVGRTNKLTICRGCASLAHFQLCKYCEYELQTRLAIFALMATQSTKQIFIRRMVAVIMVVIVSFTENFSIAIETLKYQIELIAFELSRLKHMQHIFTVCFFCYCCCCWSLLRPHVSFYSVSFSTHLKLNNKNAYYSKLVSGIFF